MIVFKQALICLALVVTTLVPAPALAQKMRLHVIDVGQGSAMLAEFSCAAILIDTGGEKNDQFASDDALLAYLETFFERRQDLRRRSIRLSLPTLTLTTPAVFLLYCVRTKYSTS